MGRGVFIAFEGPDGGGKSTQAFRLKAHLEAQGGLEVLFVREPGGTGLGERIREVLLDASLSEMGVRTELLLFMAARAQLVEEEIAPALARGAVVVSDRYLLSTLVYQGVAGGLDIEEVRRIGRFATGGLLPDLTLLLDLPALVGLGRVGQEKDRIEQKGVEYFMRIRQGYLTLAKEDPKTVVIDATQTQNEVAEAVWKAVDHVLP